MQNMYKWMGLPSDEWAFFSAEGARGPITRAVLAFFLDKGLLDSTTVVYHMSEDTVLWDASGNRPRTDAVLVGLRRACL